MPSPVSIIRWIPLPRRWWYALPTVQRRMVRHWQARIRDGRVPRRDIVRGAHTLLRWVGSTGQPERYPILIEYLQNLLEENRPWSKDQ